MKALGRSIWVAIFAVAFAWVESAVVVYLRKIYFDGDFSFPLVVVWEEGKHVISGRGVGRWKEQVSEVLLFYDRLRDLGYFLLYLALCHGGLARKPYDVGSPILRAPALGGAGNHACIDCSCHGWGGPAHYILPGERI